MTERLLGYIVVSKAGLVSIDEFGNVASVGKRYLYDTIGAAMHAAVQINEQIGDHSFRVHPVYSEKFLYC